jgi:GT2 family glycosyltransferase
MDIMEKIYILLPVHNRKEITRSFINCLTSQTFKNYHLILIDDGSSDGTAEIVKEQVKNLTIIQGKGDWWWAGSLQQGYQWLQKNVISKSDIILIINDDTSFAEDFLATAVNTFSNKNHILLSAYSYSLQTNKLFDAGVAIDWKNRKMFMTEEIALISCFSTRAIFLRWEDFLLTGGFYPRLLRHHGADYEFTLRAIRKGMRPILNPSLRIWINELTTGYNSIGSEYGWKLIRQIFSIKSSLNPIPTTILIVLTCPWRWKIQYITSIWKTTVIIIFSNLFPRRPSM